MVTVVRPSWLPFHFQRSIPLLFPYFKSDCIEITCLVKNASSYLLTTLISRLCQASSLAYFVRRINFMDTKALKIG